MVQLNQWDNLLGGFIGTATKNTLINVGGAFTVWNNVKSMLNLMSLIMSGKISLNDLVALGLEGAIGDIKYVIDNWNIISDNKIYSDSEISEFGSRLAGTYEEIVVIGATIAGVVESAKALSSVSKIILNSFDDIVKNPLSLVGKTADEVAKILGDGWTRGTYGSSGTGWKFTKGDMSIWYHPGGGKHVGAYYGFASGKLGRNKIVGFD